ncbi:retrovirus-related pol polyprotein from transposon TNT 1-94 [Tanacetum coccineum]|uniref:Retrovirus-related pol polyprotein from transposon TNT 1-94 n=1 Tax=Tanacetum coccineum TaxID=301880 RepID=A0ABQ5GGM7_9ASTR
MHNNIMVAGSRDRPPMLEIGRYAQWRSDFLRYIDTRPNDNSLAVLERTTVKTFLNMSPENKAHFESEKEAIHLILTGIGVEIYSTIDACKTAHEMWEAIERLQQVILHKVLQADEGNDQKQFDSSYDASQCLISSTTSTRMVKEVNELRAKRIAKNANPLALVATAQPYQDPYCQAPKIHKSYAPTSKASLPTRSHATTRHKGKEIAKPITPLSQSSSEEDSDPEQAQKDKEMQKNLALIAKKPKRVKDSTCHKEKMLLYKQAKKGVSLQDEQSDWLADTDEEIYEQELEAHYSYIAKIHEVPTANSGSDNEPLEQIPNDQSDPANSLVPDKEDTLTLERENFKAKLQDKDIAICELKKLIEKCKGKSVEIKFDKPFVVRQPNAQRIPKPSVLGKPAPFLYSLERKLFAKKRSVPKTNESEGLSKPVTTHNLPQTAREAGNDLLIGNRGSDLYTISLQENTSSTPICLMAKASPTKAWLWHWRISHLNFDYINLLLKKDVDETPEVLKDFLTMIQRNLQASVISVRTDRGIEFLNKTLNAFFKEEGIEHQTSTPRTPEQNGVVERGNRTLVEAAQTMLSASKLPLFFWAEAIATTCYTQNRSILILTHEKMAYHIINDRKPLIKHLHIFGCTCYLTRDGENLKKMKEKGDSCILVGYSTQLKGYRVYNKKTRLVLQRQKASNYNNSNPVPQLQNVSPSADTTVLSQQELDLLFGPLYDEFFITGTSRVNKSSSPTDNST